MSWRINTRAEAQDSRHFDHSLLYGDELADLRESIEPVREPVPFDWLGFLLGVLCCGLLAVSLAIGIGEVWHG